MTGAMIRLAIHGSIAITAALAGLSNQALAADRRGHSGPPAVYDATPAAGPDFDALRSKLRATDAIDLPTKLSLKFRFDDLVEDFRGFHAGRRRHSLDDLRRRFAHLWDETVWLVRKGDSELFWDLQAARPGLWQTFNNPAKLAALAGGRAISQLAKRELR